MAWSEDFTHIRCRYWQSSHLTVDCHVRIEGWQVPFQVCPTSADSTSPQHPTEWTTWLRPNSRPPHSIVPAASAHSTPCPRHSNCVPPDTSHLVLLRATVSRVNLFGEPMRLHEQSCILMWIYFVCVLVSHACTVLPSFWARLNNDRMSAEYS